VPELTVEKVYNAYALFYNQIFGRVFHPGRNASVDIINSKAMTGASILELGIGTGLSLPLYRADLQVTGIDIAENMLKKAQKLAKTPKVQARVNLQLMDAEKLAFPAQSFDYVLGLYVASVVSNIHEFLAEICRVCRPHGEVILVNHFSSKNRVLKQLERNIGRMQAIVGFKSDFSMEPILQCQRLKILECRNTNIFGYWKILRCQLI
jgi:phosphatidylethanolamine/phosphatidyl-N-methylethanolamine N-methyltransferase